MTLLCYQVDYTDLPLTDPPQPSFLMHNIILLIRKCTPGIHMHYLENPQQHEILLSWPSNLDIGLVVYASLHLIEIS